MKFSPIALGLSALASLALAVPTGGGNYEQCISQAEAELFIERYAAVIAAEPSDLGGPTLTARAIVARGYSETSDSANTQLGLPLGSVTVPTKQAFVVGSQQNPPVSATTLGVFVANCNYVLWQWVFTDFGSGLYPVKGFHLFEFNANGKAVQAWFEFNSIAGAADTGWTLIQPNGVEWTNGQ
ncbi:hypothetical protein LTR37_004378 [Vermiconidia calcicola]|uniref:Uncharacterized protein n=1 Tax=Vermiconidia calcicola TaxID=1690605 RepID=A0ACC3NMP8_9PEZI|nr:hypothetical protein LTR37_004378 [Vermiconidia calcicola]